MERELDDGTLDDGRGDVEGGDAHVNGGVLLGTLPQAGVERLSTHEQVHSLRAKIQTLSESCTPLGRGLEYAREDGESMRKELAHWRTLRQRRQSELHEAERVTEKSLVGIQAELERVANLIEDRRAEIRWRKAQVVENDAIVERLIRQVTVRAAG
tara:strand:+ start:235 stop:702 length:468 start_codon:yes stop_codon:yes gene_type:complete